MPITGGEKGRGGQGNQQAGEDRPLKGKKRFEGFMLGSKTLPISGGDRVGPLSATSGKTEGKVNF